jgi:ribosomal protein S12 methylthiotransferase accessory factor YcaO
MANSQKLISWLLNNSAELNLQVTEFTWVRDWDLVGVFDFQVTIELHGRTFTGRGTAPSEELAFLKAGAEAIERAFCGGLEISTMGVAVHTTESLAQQNAKRELVERDAFFGHYYSKTSFSNLENDLIFEFEQKWPNAFRQLRDSKVDCHFYKADSMLDPVLVCVFSGPNRASKFGGIIGLGSNSQKLEAMQTAFFEGLRNVAVNINLQTADAISEIDFLKIEKPRSIDRQRLARNIDYWSGFKHLFDGSTAPGQSAKKPAAPVNCYRLVSPYQELKEAPVFVSRAAFVDQNLGNVVLETRPHFLG